MTSRGGRMWIGDEIRENLYPQRPCPSVMPVTHQTITARNMGQAAGAAQHRLFLLGLPPHRVLRGRDGLRVAEKASAARLQPLVQLV